MASLRDFEKLLPTWPPGEKAQILKMEFRNLVMLFRGLTLLRTYAGAKPALFGPESRFGFWSRRDDWALRSKPYWRRIPPSGPGSTRTKHPTSGGSGVARLRRADVCRHPRPNPLVAQPSSFPAAPPASDGESCGHRPLHGRFGLRRTGSTNPRGCGKRVRHAEPTDPSDTPTPGSAVR